MPADAPTVPAPPPIIEAAEVSQLLKKVAERCQGVTNDTGSASPVMRPADRQQVAWAPDFLDLAGLAYFLSTSERQVQRLLAAGRLPAADINISGTGGPKGRRWRRDRLVAWLEGHRP